MSRNAEAFPRTDESLTYAHLRFCHYLKIKGQRRYRTHCTEVLQPRATAFVHETNLLQQYVSVFVLTCSPFWPQKEIAAEIGERRRGDSGGG